MSDAPTPAPSPEPLTMTREDESSLRFRAESGRPFDYTDADRLIAELDATRERLAEVEAELGRFRRALNAANGSTIHEMDRRKAAESQRDRALALVEEAVSAVERAFKDAVWLTDDTSASPEETDVLWKDVWRISRARDEHKSLAARAAAIREGNDG